MTRAADAVVIGGGLVGCAIARELAIRRLTVVLVERGQTGCEASAAAAGFISPQADFANDGPLFRLGLASRAAYPRWVRAVTRESGLDPALRRQGVVWVATTAADARALGARMRWQQRLGLRARRLSARGARMLVPGLGTGFAGAGFFPDDLSVDNERLAVAAALAARRAGVRITEGVAVRGVLARGGRVVGVRTDGGVQAAPIVVNAAGAWASAIALPRGATAPAVAPVRGQMVVLSGMQRMVGRPVHATDVYLAPRPDGRLLVGSTYERVGFDKRPTAHGVRSLLAAAERLVPSIAAATVLGAYAGLRPGNSDGLPVVGADGEVSGLWYACGLYRNGILLAPAVAGALADLVVDGATAWPIAALAPSRPGASLRRRTSPRAPRARRQGRPRSSPGSRRTPRPR